MYPQVIEEWKAYGQLSGDQSETHFASALEQGFRSQGWEGALTKGIETRRAQRNSGYWSAYTIGSLYANLGNKDEAFRWLNTAYQERDANLLGLKTDYLLDPLRSDPRFPELVRKVGLPQLRSNGGSEWGSNIQAISSLCKLQRIRTRFLKERIKRKR
jgi:hypothetical protein